MKKILFAALFIALACGAYAFNTSAGIGGVMDFDAVTMKASYAGSAGESTIHRMPIEIQLFIDVTYLQLSAGYMFINGYTVSGSGALSGSGSSSDTFSYISLALFGKLPFTLGPISIFPLVGLEYRLNLTYKDGSGNDLKSGLSSQGQEDLNELWLEAGVGADLIFGNFYIRPELLVGFHPLSPSDNNELMLMQMMGYTSTSMSYFTVKGAVLLGFRL